MPTGVASLASVIGSLISQVVERDRHRSEDQQRAQDKQFWAEGGEQPFPYRKQRAAENKQNHCETARGDDGAMSVVVVPAATPRARLAASADWAGFVHRHTFSHGLHKSIVARAAQSVMDQCPGRTIGL